MSLGFTLGTPKSFTFDNPLSNQNQRDGIIQAEIQELSLADLHEFHDHPFKVRDGDDMEELKQSIKEQGVISPIIVRPDPNGGYEIISGHRRVFASRAIGLEKIKATVKTDLSEADAVLMMTDSNLARENITPSEKAFAYKMRMEAMKKKRANEPAGTTRSDQLLAEELGESRSSIQRFIRLTALNSDLLDMVDDGSLTLLAGVALSYLDEGEQAAVCNFCKENDCVPTQAQAETFKKASKEGKLTAAVIHGTLKKPKRAKKAADSSILFKTVTFKGQDFRRLLTFIPDASSERDAIDKIFLMLEQADALAD